MFEQRTWAVTICYACILLFASNINAQPPPEIVTVKGRVIFVPGDAPLKNARVRLYNSTNRRISFNMKTDADGRFQFERVCEGFYKLSIYFTGFNGRVTLMHQRDVEIGGFDNMVLTVSLPALGSIAGRIIAPDGKPLANRRVYFKPCVITDAVQIRSSSVISIVTDQNGVYRLNQCVSGDYVLSVVAPHVGYKLTKIFALKPGQHLKSFDIKLNRGLTLRGIVRDQDGHPLPKIKLTLSISSPILQWAISIPAISDEDGKFVMSGLPPGRVSVSASISGTRRAVSKVTMSSLKQPSLLTLTLPRSPQVVRISGHLLRPNGEPLRNATINYNLQFTSGGGYILWRTSSTGSDGCFNLWLKLGSKSAVATLVIRAPGVGYVVLPNLKLVSGNDVLGIKARLNRYGSVSGKVFWHINGTPVANAKVTLVAIDGMGKASPRTHMPFLPSFSTLLGKGTPSAQTDEQGRFTITDLLPGRYKVTVHAGGYLEPREIIVPIKMDERVRDVNIGLVKLSTIAMTLHGAGNEPIANAECNYIVTSIDWLGRKWKKAGKVRTDANGTLVIHNVRPGMIRVCIYGVNGCYALSKPFMVREGEHVDTIPLKLMLGGRLICTASDSEGMELHNVRVSVTYWPHWWFYNPRGTGKFGVMVNVPLIDGLPPGIYCISAQLYRRNRLLYGGTAVKVANQPVSVHLKLRPPGQQALFQSPLQRSKQVTIRGLVTSIDGKPIARAVIKHGGQRTLTDATGKFSMKVYLTYFDRIARLRLKVTAEGFAPTWYVMLLTANGEVQPCHIRLWRGIPLKGRVFNLLTGKPVANATVRLYDADWSKDDYSTALLIAHTNANGEFAFDNVAPGAYTLIAKADGFERGARDCILITPRQVDEGHAVNLSVPMLPTLRLTARLIAPTGEPLKWMPCALLWEESLKQSNEARRPQMHLLQSDATGNLHFEIPAQGTYDIAIVTINGMWAKHRSMVLKYEHTKRPIIFNLKPISLSKVTGKVALPDGKPAHGALVLPLMLHRNARWLPIVHGYDEWQYGWQLRYLPNAILMTDRDGNFELPFIPTGLLRIAVMPPINQALLCSTLSQPIELNERGASVMIKLRPGGAITGEVLTQSGKPVANARIFCKRIEPFSSSTMWALTNTDGRFSLSGLVHGLYIVKAIMRSDSSLHYSQTVCRVKANTSIHLQLRLRGVGDVKPTKQESLSSAGLLVGRVLLPGGKASGAYARIYAVRLSDNMQEAGVTPIHYLTRQRRAVRSLPPWLRSYTEPIGIADEHGKFNIALPAGDYLISAWLPGYARTELDQIVKVTDGGKRYVTINLCEGGAIAGRIVCIDDANNLMPRCLRVQLLRYRKVNAQRQQRSMTSPSNQRWRASLPVHTFLTQSDGAFSISHLMPGTYTIAINDRARLYYIGKVTVRNGEVLNGLKWTFRPIGGRIHGTVRAAKHRKPIRNATIMLYRNLRWIATATSSSNGTYAFEGLPHGTYTLHCYANGYANVTIMDITLDNEASEREVNIELWRGGSIYGKVVNEIGEPLKGLLVTTATEMHAIAPSGPTLRSTITDKDGCFTLPSLSPGEYVLTIWNCNGQLMHTNKISIRDGSTVRMPPIQFKGLKQWTISDGFVEIP